MTSAQGNNEWLNVKARNAELELGQAQLKEEVHSLRSQKMALEEQVRVLTQRLSSQSTSHNQQELYAAQKEVLRLTDHKASLEQQLEKANETIQGLHRNIAREVQKAKDEVERQSIFLRSQILEQKEINTALQEKLMTSMQVSKQFEEEGMYDNVIDTILITSDAVLQKFRQELRNHGLKGKYDVNVDINGRNMVLSGRRVNVQLLKAEVMTALNEAYIALVDPSKYVSAAKAKDDAARHEIEHLRRTVLTHESTIQSLHVALQHAQDRTQIATTTADEASRDKSVMQAQLEEARGQHHSTVSELQRSISVLEDRLREQESTSTMALQAMKSEADVSQRYRQEIQQLRDEIQRLTDIKELAERSVFVTSQQLEVAKTQMQDSVRAEVHIAELKHRLEEAEHRAASVDSRIASARREGKEQAERLMVDLGTLQERLRRALEEVGQAKRDLQTATIERDAARAELQQSRDIINEMRSKMVHLSVVTLESQKAAGAGGISQGGGAFAQTPIESILVGNERHQARLEEENAALRTELQHAFEDMRAVATSLKETRVVRERALEDAQRLEAEKGKLYEERQRLEREMMEERMTRRERESELELQVLTLRDELTYQQKRVELLHNEYQKRMQDHMNEVAAAKQFAVASLEAEPIPETLLGSPSTVQSSGAPTSGRWSRPAAQRAAQAYPQMLENHPNDPSQIPQRTPKQASMKASPAAAAAAGQATPTTGAGVFTLRSVENGSTPTPRRTVGGSAPTNSFRITAVGGVSSLESPPR